MLLALSKQSTINVFPEPVGPHMNTFSPRAKNFSNREISFSWSVGGRSFFCGIILMKESITDEFTDQALDIFLESDTLQTRIVEPIKRKVFPYLICIGLFNLILFIMLAYVARKISGPR